MKLVIYYGGLIHQFTLERVDQAYVGGFGDGSGYTMKKEDWDKPFESVGEHILMSMYEGWSCAGSYTNEDWTDFSWSWAVLPENREESEHLRIHCNNPEYREMGNLANLEDEDAGDDQSVQFRGREWKRGDLPHARPQGGRGARSGEQPPGD